MAQNFVVIFLFDFNCSFITNELNKVNVYKSQRGVTS